MYRVSEFEHACEQSPYNVDIKLIEYQSKTLFVKCVFGIVTDKDARKIQVGWNEHGEAFVAGCPCVEFNLKFDSVNF